MQEVLHIQGGKLVSGFGVVEADLWIQEGKVIRVGRDTLRKKYQSRFQHIQTIDATNYYLLPGFVSFTRLQVRRMKHAQAYREAIAPLVRQGVTTIIDTIPVESWMDAVQADYQLALHINCPIDYVQRIGLELDRFSPDEVRKWAKKGIRHVEITQREQIEPERLQWDELSRLLRQYRIAVELRFEAERGQKTDWQKERLNEWGNMCSQAKVRAKVPGVHPFEFSELDPYYLISTLRPHQCDAVFAFLLNHWYQYLSVVGSIQEIRLSSDRRSWNPEDVLSLIVRLASANAAKTAGCYPQKGALLPGSDADVVFLHKEDWLTNFDLSPILNLSEMCLPTQVMVKGRWAYQEQRLLATPGSGRHLREVRPYNYVL